MLIMITAFISVIGHMVRAGFYNYLLLLSIVYPFCLHKALQWSRFFTIFPDRSGPLVLPGLGCSFSLSIIARHGNTKGYLKGYPVFQTYSSFPLLWNSSSISLVIRTNHPRQHHNSLLCQLIQRHEEPKVAES